MNDFLRLLGIDIYWNRYMPSLPNGDDGLTYLIILAAAVAGTVILSGLLSFKSYLNTFIVFVALFAGAIAANVFGAHWSTPGLDEMVKVAVLANIGMAIAGFALLLVFREKQSQ